MTLCTTGSPFKIGDARFNWGVIVENSIPEFENCEMIDSINNGLNNTTDAFTGVISRDCTLYIGRRSSWGGGTATLSQPGVAPYTPSSGVLNINNSIINLWWSLQVSSGDAIAFDTYSGVFIFSD